eukprot:Colp12_sorted_trinity150504_noHs@11811
MSQPWYPLTANWKRAVTAINEVPNNAFPLLLTKIIQKLHLTSEKTFTKEEEAQLSENLGLPTDKLTSVLETSAFVFEQAAYHNANANNFEKNLSVTGFSDEKIAAILQVWSKEGTSLISSLREKAFAPSELKNVNWRLNLQISQGDKAKMKSMNALLELLIGSSDGKTHNLKMEFSHEELYQFYNQLEVIQQQLDELA